jgi:hypothetical protein
MQDEVCGARMLDVGVWLFFILFFCSFLLCFNFCESSHVWPQDFRDRNGAVFVLEIFQDGDEDSRHCAGGAVQSVNEFFFPCVFAACN